MARANLRRTVQDPRALEARLLVDDGDGADADGDVRRGDGAARALPRDDDLREAARLEGIEEGDCKVTFPRREGDDIEPIGTVGEPARA